MPKKELALKNATILAAYLLVVWGFYRFLFKLPEEIEELLIKPVIWLVPVYLLLKKEKQGFSSLGITSKNLFPSIYISLALGILFALEGVIVNFLKYGSTNFGANIGQNAFAISLVLSAATAISEELAFRGYLFKRLWHALESEWSANLISSFVWALIHIPIAIFWWNLGTPQTFAFLIITTIFGIGSAYVFARTKNIVASIILHILWSWPITLFR
jgi:membrane protease YdiL (CAAX protease family)